MDNKLERAGNSEQDNTKTGWEGVAALADDSQTDTQTTEMLTQSETIFQPEENKRILPEENLRLNKLLRADDENSRKLNLENIQKYLNEVDIDPNLAEALLSSGIFDVANNQAYRLSLWQEEDEKGRPYLMSTTRDTTGHSSPSGHNYKIFEYDGLLVAYDSIVRFEEKHHVSDELPYDKEPSRNKYKVEKDRIALIDPDTGKPIALGKYSYNMLNSLAPTDDSIENIDSENLADGLEKFDFRIIDSERFSELADKQMENNSIINEVEKSITKQKEEADKKEKNQMEKKSETKEEELSRDIESEIVRSGILESIVDYVKNKRLIMKFIKSNDGHVNGIELPMGNYQLQTDLKKELLELPEGMDLETRLYGSTDGERQYDVLNKKGKKIGVLDGWE